MPDNTTIRPCADSGASRTSVYLNGIPSPDKESCAAQSNSPNGNPGVDGMISVIAHELEEAVTDPDLNAWYDSSGAENADKCAWTFGHFQYQVANGSWANMRLGTRDYLIQRNLQHNVSGDLCKVDATHN